MAAANELVFKLIIDGKEAIATLDLAKGEFIEVDKEITKVGDSFGNAFKKLAEQTQIVNKELNHFDNVNKAAIPGVNNMRMAIGQFAWILGDANMFLVNTRMGMMSIANNIPMVIQAFTQARQAAASAGTTISSQFAAALAGGGGVMLAVNAAMLLLQTMPLIFDKISQSARKAAEEGLEKFRKELKNIDIDELKTKMNDLNAEIIALQSVTSFENVMGGMGLAVMKLFGYKTEAEINLEAANQKLKEAQEREKEINEQRQTRIGALKYEIDILDKKIEKVKNEEGAEKEIQILVDKRAEKQKELNKLLETTEERNERIKKQEEEKKRKIEEQFEARLKELELSQEHAIKMAEIEEQNDAMILEMKKQHLVERIKLYEEYGKDITKLTFELIETEAMLQKALTKPAIETESPEDILLGDIKDVQEYEQEFQRTQLENWYAQEDEKIKAYENYLELKEVLDREYAARKEQLERQQTLNTLQITSQMLGQLSNLFGKHTAAYKILAIAQVWIETYKAVAALYSPPPVGVGPVLAPFLTAAVVGMGAVQAANIAKQDVTLKGYARGGAIVGENGVEIIAPAQDYASGMAELINRTVFEVRNHLTAANGSFDNSVLIQRIDMLNEKIEQLALRPAYAIIEEDTAIKIGDIYNYYKRTSR